MLSVRGPISLFNRRFAGLALLLVLSVSACVALAVAVAHSARLSFAQLAEEEIKAAPLAQQFRSAIEDLSGVLGHFGQRPAMESSLALRQRRDRLTRWLTGRRAAARTPEENEVLDIMDARTRDLFQQLDTLDGATGGFASAIRPDTLAELNAAAGQLGDLADAFAAIHDRRSNALVEASHASVRQLRLLVFVCLGLSVVATGVVGTVFYRGLVRPLEAQLVESEILLVKREKLAALGTLAAGVAHEIRNPLTAIKARLYMLQRSQLPADAAEDAGAIMHEIDRLDRIVREVLDYARPVAPTLERVELKQWLDEFVRFISPGIGEAGIQLTANCPTPIEVLADPAQLRQIFLNLVGNSREALAGRPGVIAIGIHRASTELRGRKAETVELSVTDDGPGIPEQVQARLFDPFFTTKPSGTGLGLSTVARLVDHHGGIILFRTGSRTGTRFSVHLPLAAAAVRSEAV